MKVGWDWVNNSALLKFYASINFLHFAVLLFLISASVFVAVSYMTRPPTEEKMKVFAVDTKELKADLGDKFNAGLSILLGAIIVALWIYFSPIFFK